MSPEERDAFLAEERTCRIATVAADGTPHVTPLWFVWHGRRFWIYSLLRSKRWTNLTANPLVSVVVDTGADYLELRGVELVGRARPAGEQPRRGEPSPELEPVERIFNSKYGASEGMAYDGRHAWACITPEREYTWDFRKIAGAR